MNELEQTHTRISSARTSPDDPSMVRVEHATVSVELDTAPNTFFDAFSGWAGYEHWAPELQGAGHWLMRREGGRGSQFILYDKPGGRHLAHFGVVTELERARRFAWRAPFSEWKRAYCGTVLELTPTTSGGVRATETFFFDAAEEHLPVVAGFMALRGLDEETMKRFLEARLRGLDRWIQAGEPSDEETSFAFSENRVVALDWPNRISSGEWIRLLYADGEVDFVAPESTVFNVFSRFARYADWTHTIHVGAEWHRVEQGGVGSRFLIWEKPGDRHVMHYATVTEFERDRHFAWRAPFSEWNKVFIGTSLHLSPRAGGGCHGYHVIWVDVPREYLPIFTGFGTLPGIDLEYETWHIQEEVRGINELLRSGALSDDDRSYFFDRDRVIARDWPTERGAPYPYPSEVATLKPDRVMTYEEAAVVVSEMMAKAIPGPRFFRKWRDPRRTRRFNPALDGGT